MEISRNNYEVALIDYLDGKLNPLEVAELLLFLEQNPDIKSEFDGLENASIASIEQDIFTDKESLKKKSASAFIDSNTIQEFLIRKIENDLNVDENTALSSYIASNKKYERELLLFEKTKLTADASIIFDDKKSLKREAKIIPLYYYISAVAAILILIFALPVLFQYFQNSAKINSEVAVKDSVSKKEKEQLLAPYKTDSLYKNNKTASTFTQQKNSIASSQNKLKKREDRIARNQIAANTNKIISKENDSASIVNTKLPDTQLAENNSKQNTENINNTVAENPEQENESVTNPIPEKSFLSLKELAENKIKSLTKDNLIEEKTSYKKDKKITGWDIAALGVKAINKISNKKIKLSNKYNEDGKLVEYAIASNNFEFSRQK